MSQEMSQTGEVFNQTVVIVFVVSRPQKVNFFLAFRFLCDIQTLNYSPLFGQH